jgi:TonB family protein
MTVYYAGPGVTAPALLQNHLTNDAHGHCKKDDGTAILSAIVGADGVAQDVKTFQPGDLTLDNFAVGLLTTSQFTPGTYNGSPVPVAIYAALSLETCAVHVKNSSGRKSDGLRLRASPAISIGLARTPQTSLDKKFPVPANPSSFGTTTSTGIDKASDSVSAPVPIFAPDPHYSDYAKSKRIQGKCLVSLIVDADGIPRNVQIFKSLEPSLDRNAIEAVNIWWFRPAMKGLVPVPVMITVEVDFRLY